MKMVSVIIPIFNDHRFLKTAVESVLKQPEVEEILLVDDGSTDGSYELALEMMAAHPEVLKVLIHENHSNWGAAVTRNLGIQHAKKDIIAFLDADDKYLDNRFAHSLEILMQQPEIDGVYEAIGTFYYDEKGKELHHRRMREIGIPGLGSDLTTMTKKIHPNDFFEELLIGNCGWIHFNGLTVRKSIFDKCGLLDPVMRYGQDTELFFRMSLYAKLAPGDIENPVAMRGVYSDNSTLSVFTSKQRADKNNFYNAYMWKKCFQLATRMNFSKEVNKYLFFRHVDHFNRHILNSPLGLRRKIYKFLIVFGLIMEHPGFLRKMV